MRTVRPPATLVAAALAAVALAGCGGDPATPRDGVRVQELTADRSGAVDLDEARAGAEISLRATVAQVLSPESFVLPREDTAAAPLLVLTDIEQVRAGQDLQLAGRLEVFSYADAAEDYDLGDAAAYAAFEDALVLVADLVDDDLPEDDR